MEKGSSLNITIWYICKNQFSLSFRLLLSLPLSTSNIEKVSAGGGWARPNERLITTDYDTSASIRRLQNHYHHSDLLPAKYHIAWSSGSQPLSHISAFVNSDL